MKYPLTSIRDSKIGFYPAQCEESVESAKRNFSMAINNSNGLMGFAPGDFTLFHVADFDSEKGVVEPVIPIEELVSGLQVFVEK